MINMMRADLYRMFRGPGIYLAICFLLMMSTTSVIMKEAGYVGNSTVMVSEEPGGDMVTYDDLFFEESDAEGTDAMLVRGILSTNNNLYYPFIIVVFVLLMADFTNKTIKNTLTSAVGKKTYFLYKMLMCLLTATVFTVANNLYVYGCNYLINGSRYTEPIGMVFRVTISRLPMLLGVVSLLLLLGFAVKKAAVFNAITIPFLIVVQIVLFALYTLTEADWIETFLSKYELQTALRNLAYFPEKTYLLTCAGIGFGEVAVAAVLGYVLFQKSEIR